MLMLLIVEDNAALRQALRVGLEGTGEVQVVGQAASGEEALAISFETTPEAVLMDIELAGALNGIQAAVALRREHPRLPVVFYSIQDNDAYYRDFLNSGMLSHYAYVRKSNYLLPDSILPLLRDAAAGRSFIDPEIEERVHEVRHRDKWDPLKLLEPSELRVAELLASGLTNEQIAARLHFHDKRTISRTNGQIYAAWNLNDTPTEEKVARTRAAIIYRRRQLLVWDEDGVVRAANPQGDWLPVDLLAD